MYSSTKSELDLKVLIGISLSAILLAIVFIFLPNFFPNDFKGWAYGNFIFGLPHIIISLILYGQIVSISHDKKALLFQKNGFLIYILIPLIIYLFSAKYMVIYYSFFTLKHIFYQQLGISRKIFGQNLKLYDFYITSMILALFIPYLFTDLNEFKLDAGNNEFSKYFIFYNIGITIVFYLVNLKVLKSVYISKSIFFILTTLIMIITSLFISQEQLFLVAVLPRVAHDFTAIYIYYKNDAFKLDFFKMLFIITITMGAIFLLEHYNIYLLTLALGFSHYYLESYLWKREGVFHVEIV